MRSKAWEWKKKVFIKIKNIGIRRASKKHRYSNRSSRHFHTHSPLLQSPRARFEKKQNGTQEHTHADVMEGQNHASCCLDQSTWIKNEYNSVTSNGPGV